MKKILLVLLIIMFTINITAQDSFNYDNKGLTPKYLVKPFENTPQSELFNKSINWIMETYRNPNEVIKTTIVSKTIRFEGISISALANKNARYLIEIEFKNNKYKFKPLEVFVIMPSSVIGGDYEINLESGEDYYKRNGDKKSRTKDLVVQVKDLLNGIEESLNNYINNYEKTSDW